MDVDLPAAKLELLYDQWQAYKRRSLPLSSDASYLHDAGSLLGDVIRMVWDRDRTIERLREEAVMDRLRTHRDKGQ